MGSRRRTHFGFGELAINLIGLAFMMLIMFQFLPGGGGIKAVSALGSLAVMVVGGLVALLIVFLAATLVIRSRRRTPIERGNSTIFHRHTPSPIPFQSQSPALAEEDKRDIAALNGTFVKPAQLMPFNILSQLRTIDWFQFEKLVALTYRKLGYDVERRGVANPDGGIDLIIKKVGQRSAVQCKHWKNWNVGVKTVREFLGALKDSGIEQGILVTLNGYTGDAKQLADKHGIEIINESKLAQMLESTDARFDPEARHLLMDCRKHCPKCESELVLRTAGKGPRVGQQFWGCSTFPKCHFKMAA